MRTPPDYVKRLFRLLGGDATSSIAEPEWNATLAFADRTQLTLLLDETPCGSLPSWISDAVAVRLAKNQQRNLRLMDAYQEIERAFTGQDVSFVLLKGFTHAASFGVALPHRVQYDLDLLCEPSTLQRALAALRGLGYRPHTERLLSDQHVPAMVRPSSWRWRNDYFDPEMPVAVDLHTRAWTAEADRIVIEGTDQFWARRTMMEFEGGAIPAFRLPDRLAFAAIHALRHVLRNDPKPAHMLEIARFVAKHRDDSEFWREWSSCHPAELQLLQTLIFRLAAEWFGYPERPSAPFPARVEAWFQEFSWSPVVGHLNPNKDVLWLHMALLPSLRDQASVFRRRVIPWQMPPPAALPSSGKAAMFERLGTTFRRASYHLVAIASVLAAGLRWRRRIASSRASQTSR